MNRKPLPPTPEEKLVAKLEEMGVPVVEGYVLKSHIQKALAKVCDCGHDPCPEACPPDCPCKSHEVEAEGEELILNRKTYSFNKHDGSDGKTAVEVDHSNLISKYKVGDTFTVHIAAPGSGAITYKITKIDDEGMWGTLEEDLSVIEPEVVSSIDKDVEKRAREELRKWDKESLIDHIITSSSEDFLLEVILGENGESTADYRPPRALDWEKKKGLVRKEREEEKYSQIELSEVNSSDTLRNMIRKGGWMGEITFEGEDVHSLVVDLEEAATKKLLEETESSKSGVSTSYLGYDPRTKTFILGLKSLEDGKSLHSFYVFDGDRITRSENFKSTYRDSFKKFVPKEYVTIVSFGHTA